MPTLKRIGLFIAVPLLGISIFAGVSLWSLQQYFGDTSHLKQWLIESNMYAAVRKEIVSQTVKATKEANKNDASITLSTPVVTKALEKSLTQPYLQATAEEILDGTYAWLAGSAPKPTYNIDVDPVKKAFASSIVDSADARLDTLPDCVLPDQATTTDPFTVNCKPPASVSNQELQRLKKEIVNNKDFLPQDITADTYALSETASSAAGQQPPAQPWYQSVSALPTVFQWMARGSIIFLVLGLLSVAGVVFCSTSRRNGVRRVGVTMLTSGLALALASAAALMMGGFIRTPVADKNSPLYEPVLALFKLATEAVSRWQLITSLVIAAIGGGIVLGLRLTKSNVPAVSTVTKNRK